MSTPAAFFFVTFLAVQLGVPLYQLTKPRPTHFGWQMFSGYSHYPDFALVLPDTVLPVDGSDFVAHMRSDYDLTRYLPPHLCRRFPEARAVLLSPRDGEPHAIACP